MIDKDTIKEIFNNGTKINTIRLKYFRTKEVVKELESITSYLNDIKGVTICTRIFCWVNDIIDIPMCEYCGKNKIRFMNITMSKTCSGTCGSKLSIINSHKPEVMKRVVENSKKTLLAKYGVDSPSKVPEFQKKMHETAIRNHGSLKAAYIDTANKIIKEKYGVDNISQIEEVKEKKKETSRQNYGTDFPWQSEKGKLDQKEGVYNKYGVNNISQVKEIKKKKIRTSQEHYGVDNPSQSQEIIQKIIETTKERYGVRNYSQYSERRKQLRIEYVKRVTNNFQGMPNYNPEGCKIIDEYGKQHGYNFQHAENGGEYYIKELGYWVDGYDPINNIVIEIDESHHFDSDGNLCERDIIRQAEIEEQLKCKFIRIKYDR